MKAVNLIPGERRRKSRDVVGRSGGGALAVLALIAGLAVLAVMYGSARHKVSSQAGEVASLTAQTNAVEARTGRLSSYSSFVSMAEQRMQTVSQLVESRFDWSHALNELGRVLPTDTALDSLHGAIGSPSVQVSASNSSSSATSTSETSSTPPGSIPVFTISGCAASQSVVAQTLQRLRLMDGVTEVQLQSSTSSGSSGGGSASAGGGSCSGSDASFTVQVGFAALPVAPALSASAGVTTAAAHGHGVKEQISDRGKGAPR
jgi:Tfp pilus assembly protein PilN